MIGKEEDVYGADIAILERTGTERHQNIIIYTGDYGVMSPEKEFTYTIPYRNIEIEKVDSANSEKKLSGVKFKFKHNASGLYLMLQNGTITYTTEANASEWVTGTDGKLTQKITNVFAGDYTAIETYNPNELYDWVGNVTILANENMKQIGNKQKYVNLSGYVWEDISGSKDGNSINRNSLWDGGQPDIRVDGVQVMLKDSSGNIVKNKNGVPMEAETKNGRNVCI